MRLHCIIFILFFLKSRKYFDLNVQLSFFLQNVFRDNMHFVTWKHQHYMHFVAWKNNYTILNKYKKATYYHLPQRKISSYLLLCHKYIFRWHFLSFWRNFIVLFSDAKSFNFRLYTFSFYIVGLWCKFVMNNAQFYHLLFSYLTFYTPN